jgi:preprotein translocase subunit SecY
VTVEGCVNMTALSKRTCFYSFLTTGFLVGLYLLGNQISLPGINSAVLASISERKAGIFMLGYKPFATGFVVVELLSFILPVGRRLRNRASDGRIRLNIASIATSLVICGIQALAVAVAMEKATSLVPNPGWPFRLLICATLMGGAILVCCIAKLISWRGAANGFCILIAVDILSPIFRRLGLSPDDLLKMKLIYWTECFGAIAVVLVLIAYYRKTATAKAITGESDSTVDFDLPAFPQGIPPLICALSVLSLPSVIRNIWIPGSSAQIVSFWISFWGTTVLIVAFSAIGVALFSSKKRLVNNLPVGVRLNDDIERLLRNQVIKGTAVLAGGSAILLTIERLFGHVLILDYANLIFLSAIALDAIEQLKFFWKHGRSVELIELDNPHLASYLKSLFESRGIDVVVQTYHFRRLLFFFGPLTKMRMLIASEDVEPARELVDWKSIQII